MIALNPDLIERVEATPDTVVTMLDDKKFLVAESLEEVMHLITDYRAYVIARANDLSVSEHGGRPALHVVPNELIASSEIAEMDEFDPESHHLDNHDPDGVHLEWEPVPDGRVHLEFRSSPAEALRRRSRRRTKIGDETSDEDAEAPKDGSEFGLEGRN